MARVYQNIIMQGVKGTLGDQLIFKKDKAGRTIISVMPTFDEDRTFSLAQQVQHQAFREATAYAKDQKDNPIYLAKAEGTPMNAYNVAVADWFNRPQILEVDLTAWHGAAGEAIRMRVQDDVLVAGVTVTISDGDESVLESGQATERSALWWEYAPTGDFSGQQVTLTIAARDLPGHVTEYSQVRTFSA